VRIARFEHHGSERLGIVDGEALRVLPRGTDLLGLLALDPEHRERQVRELVAAEERALVADVHLLAPLVPRSFRDFITFEEHAEGVWMRRGSRVPDAWYEIPTFYFTNPIAVIGARDDVRIPPPSRYPCRVLAAAEASAHRLGGCSRAAQLEPPVLQVRRQVASEHLGVAPHDAANCSL